MTDFGGSEAGYTLIEALVALMIIGLTMTGMIAAVRAVSDLAKRADINAEASTSNRMVANAMDHLLEGYGPFSSSGGLQFQGSDAQFQFDCGSKGSCTAAIGNAGPTPLLRINQAGASLQIRLTGSSDAHFAYGGSRTAGDHWPPDNPTNWQRLRTVEVISTKHASSQILSITSLWRQGEPIAMSGSTVP